jgi:hypothetical protein
MPCENKQPPEKFSEPPRSATDTPTNNNTQAEQQI